MPASKGQLGLLLLPLELDTPGFREAWENWLADRAERRLPRYTARAQTMQFKRLEEMGHDTAIAAIEWSITQGYKGIFPPPAARPTPAAQPAKQPTTWELQKKLEMVEARIKELKGRSPGEHCELWDFLSKAELEEYSTLIKRRKELRSALIQS